MENNKYHLGLIIGDYDNINDLMYNFSLEKEVEPYILYEFNKRDKYRQIKIDVLKKILPFSFENEQQTIIKYIEQLENLTDDDYYELISSEGVLDDNNNCISQTNPQGKFESYELYTLLASKKTGEKKYYTELLKKEWEPIDESHITTLTNIWDVCTNKKTTNDNILLELCDKIKKTNPQYFDEFKNINEYITIHSIRFNSIILNGEWIDFNVNDVKSMIKLQNILGELPSDVKLTSFLFYV